MQEASSSSSPLPALSNGYQPLPSLYLGFLAIWAASGFSWAFSSWRNRHFQVPSKALNFLHLVSVATRHVVRSFFSDFDCVAA